MKKSVANDHSQLSKQDRDYDTMKPKWQQRKMHGGTPIGLPRTIEDDERLDTIPNRGHEISTSQKKHRDNKMDAMTNPPLNIQVKMG